MAYTPYATVEDYEALGLETFDGIEEALRVASRHIDTLTFNRIIGVGGIEYLTPFQQEIIKEVTCRQALFEYENDDAINSVLEGYSINGVTAKFGDGYGVQVIGGIVIARSNYALLDQTGLTCRLARYIWRNIRD